MLYFIVSLAAASYLPGISPKSYQKGEEIKLFVNKLDSSITQLPFEYYYLNYCKPEKFESERENLGEILSGDIIENSAYKIFMGEANYCKDLCETKNTRYQTRMFEWMIDNEYRANWLLDNLPSGYRVSVPETKTNLAFYKNGIPIGFTLNGVRYIYNHHHIIVKVYKNKDQTFTVVGFLVQLFSFETETVDVCNRFNWKDLVDIEAQYQEKIVNFDENFEIYQEIKSNKPYQKIGDKIRYSYSVSFVESKTSWSSRWDVYLYSQGGDIHWLSIINSFGMVLLLSLMVAHLFRKTINRDISAYNESIDDLEADSGWKQLTGDIFRPPVNYGLFVTMVGTGIQVICMTMLTLGFACVGFMSPDHRGALLTSMLFLFAFMGCFGGYASSRLYKVFGGENWKINSLGTAFLFPGLCFLVFFFINFLIWEEDSSGAVSFASLIELLFIWFGISVPLVFTGSAIGYKQTAFKNPCKVSKIPKPIPVNKNQRILSLVYILSGSLPFGCMFIELNYIMKSLWHHTMFYYFFGFLFLCFIVLVITSAEVSILMTYISLCREDYRWWWLSFKVAGSSGMYLFFYSALYYFSQLNISRFSSTVLYFGYMFMASIGYGLITGTVGFISTYIFIRKIFSLVKSD
jgi:transmembrane 9 superfamily member 2/4